MNIIGHIRQREILDRQIRLGVLSHAYLFSGLPHVGKRTVAEVFAKALLCQKQTSKQSLTFCGTCPACTSFDARAHADVLFVESVDEKGETRSIGIEEIRRVRERISHSAFGGRSIVLLDDAGSMTREASNALLKILEPPLSISVAFLKIFQ